MRVVGRSSNSNLLNVSANLIQLHSYICWFMILKPKINDLENNGANQTLQDDFLSPDTHQNW